MKCPFCKCEESIHLSGESIRRAYEKITNEANMISTESGTYSYPIKKSLCTGCGMVFEKMANEDVQRYKDEKQYFTNRF